MSRPRVLLATCTKLPDLPPDEQTLVPALAALGIEGRPAIWDDPAVDWGAAAAVIVRSTWDYHLRRDAFLAWADQVGGATRLLNPPAMLRWNSHKAYMRELEAAEVPIVPTVWVRPGGGLDLRVTSALLGWDEVVIKPAISANARGTLHAAADDPAAQAHLAALAGEGHEVMVQPFQPAVLGEGERSIVIFGGVPSHAVRRSPVLAAPGGAAGPTTLTPVSQLVPIAPDEAAFARQVLAAAPPGALYARVDVIRDAQGALCLMELELVEPGLFLDLAPGSAEALARAIAAAIAER